MSTFSEFNDPIHHWFGLSYAQYLTLPRSVLQSMPKDWQAKFTELLDQISTTLEVSDMPNYKVTAVDGNGKKTADYFQDYERGRRVIPAKPKEV